MTSIARQLRSRSPLPALTEWLSGFPDLDTMRPFFDGHLIKVEVDQSNDRFVVRAEMPGVDPEKDIAVTVREGLLTIRAERTEQHEYKGRSEFEYGSFVRTLALPTGAREDDITAGYDKGILTVTVPVAETAESGEKKVAITSGP
ncbi:Hsp20/alpha crystallin family protein [Nocardia higoensis]|uniref:Hsp20/alpha crystallin family protein n=1 Tax=Nocardia higoensis TaxID=228599 RepID=UPI0002F08715|nr:Hsp20/alpha crystallin family protein [Nocardia higoensis]